MLCGRSGADISRVKSARDGGVFGAFEDGTTVGEDGHFIGSDTKAKKKIILAHVVHNGGQAQFKSVEIHGAACFVNLHGIAAAQSDVRLGLAIEKRKILFRARATFRIAGHAHRLHVAAPNIAGNQPAREGFRMTGEKL